MLFYIYNQELFIEYKKYIGIATIIYIININHTEILIVPTKKQKLNHPNNGKYGKNGQL